MTDMQLVVCYGEMPAGKCVLYKGGNYDEVLKNMTLEDSNIAQLRMEIQNLSNLVLIITEVLSVAIVLVFILVLVLAWRINRERRRTFAQKSQQIFMNKAYQPEEDINNRTLNMQYVYAHEVKLPLDSGLDIAPTGAQHNIQSYSE